MLISAMLAGGSELTPLSWSVCGASSAASASSYSEPSESLAESSGPVVVVSGSSSVSGALSRRSGWAMLCASLGGPWPPASCECHCADSAAAGGVCCCQDSHARTSPVTVVGLSAPRWWLVSSLAVTTRSSGVEAGDGGPACAHSAAQWPDRSAYRLYSAAHSPSTKNGAARAHLRRGAPRTRCHDWNSGVARSLRVRAQGRLWRPATAEPAPRALPLAPSLIEACRASSRRVVSRPTCANSSCDR